MTYFQNESLIGGGSFELPWQIFTCTNFTLFDDSLSATWEGALLSIYIDFGHDDHMTMTIPIFLSEASAGTGGGGASGKINQEMLFCLTSPPPPTNVWAPQETFRKR